MFVVPVTLYESSTLITDSYQHFLINFGMAVSKMVPFPCLSWGPEIYFFLWSALLLCFRQVKNFKIQVSIKYHFKIRSFYYLKQLRLTLVIFYKLQRKKEFCAFLSLCCFASGRNNETVSVWLLSNF